MVNKATKPAFKASEKTVKGRDYFECETCKKVYASERGIMQHVCPVKARQEEAASPLGQAAYFFYAKWLHATKKGIVSRETFINSKYYQSFIRFAKFNKALQLSDVDLYIRVMVQRKITPELFSDDRAYGIYLEHVQHYITPTDSVKITANELERISREYECEISEVFEKCNANEIIQKIRERKLSPWLLLKSAKFRAFLGTLSDEQTNSLQTLIDAEFWGNKLRKDPVTAKFMKECAEAMGI